MLYTVDRNGEVLAIDLGSLQTQHLGSFGVTYDWGGLSCDPLTHQLFMTASRANPALHTINLNTGAATLVGHHGVIDAFSLAVHPTTERGVRGHGPSAALPPPGHHAGRQPRRRDLADARVRACPVWPARGGGRPCDLPRLERADTLSGRSRLVCCSPARMGRRDPDGDAGSAG